MKKSFRQLRNQRLVHGVKLTELSREMGISRQYLSMLDSSHYRSRTADERWTPVYKEALDRLIEEREGQ